MSNTATVTLIRGRSYTYKDVQYMVGEPKTVTAELGTELENEIDEVLDSDGESRVKPRFKVTYNETKGGHHPVKSIASVKKLGGKTLQTSAKSVGGGIKKRPVKA